jgi:hypothetical protein
MEGINENTKLWDGYAVAWLQLLVTRPNNGSAGEDQRGREGYYWLDTGEGEGASLSVFEDKAGADESIHIAAEFVKEHLADFVMQKTEVTEGPVKSHS